MKLPKFTYFEPKTLEEALHLLANEGDGVHVMAGGTDLVVKMKHGLLRPKTIIGLREIKGINRISFNAQEGLTIGATALLADVASHPKIRKHYPAIAYAPSKMANVQIRNMGTVAGNLCNAAPSADNAPSLRAMSAEVTLASLEGERRLSLDEFFEGPGLTVIRPGEIMTSIFVPLPSPQSGTSYQRLSARGHVDMAAVCVGAMVVMNGEICKEGRIVLGAVAPTPMRALKAEESLQGKPLTPQLLEKAGILASEESRPITDVRASADYRKRMVAVLTRRTLVEAHDRAQKR